MKQRTLPLIPILLVALWSLSTVGSAAPLVTSRNSTLSVPSPRIATNVFPWATNLIGSNWMVSSVSPITLNGGRVTLVNSLQWARQHHGGFDDSAYDMVLRSDGSI